MSKAAFFYGMSLLALVFWSETAFGAARLADPTRPPSAVTSQTAASASHWLVSSILFSPQRRVAVVNGRLVAEGDVVEGATVVAIDSDTVVLRRHGRRFSVSLHTGGIKESCQDTRKIEGKQTP